jgi:hypothetical protein
MTTEEIIALMNGDEKLRIGIVNAIPTFKEGETLLNNFAKQHFEKNIGEEISKIYNNLDEDVFKVLGVRKPAEMKTYEFIKQQLSDLKAKSEDGGKNKDEKVKELENQLKELQAKAEKAGDYEKKYMETQSALQHTKEEYENKIKGLETQAFESAILADLNTGRSGLNFDPKLPKDVIDTYVNTHVESIKKHAKLVDGKVVYYKEDGTPWLDANNMMNPITASGIFAEKLKPILASNSGGGGGAPRTGKTGIETGEGGKPKKVILDTEKFNSKTTFLKHFEEVAKEHAIEVGSKEFQELLNESSKEHKYLELPRE